MWLQLALKEHYYVRSIIHSGRNRLLMFKSNEVITKTNQVNKHTKSEWNTCTKKKGEWPGYVDMVSVSWYACISVDQTMMTTVQLSKSIMFTITNHDIKLNTVFNYRGLSYLSQFFQQIKILHNKVCWNSVANGLTRKKWINRKYFWCKINNLIYKYIFQASSYAESWIHITHHSNKLFSYDAKCTISTYW